ncbi:hypothetical protein [Azospirillum brasilense]|uniref:hypothetical protein n=1 Tax=Azospirillum brasilense TaxID=192 RepID=UPI00200021EB|nr:hypothetical protein [Azospirillum brasilense]
MSSSCCRASGCGWELRAAAIALGLYFGAYCTEIVRAGLDAIPGSQVEAGQCLG